MSEKRHAAMAIFVLATIVACHARSRSEDASKDAGADAMTLAAGLSCTSNAGCANDEACVFTPALCGKGKRPGACRKKPTACDDTYSPVCGCDRKTYSNECQARAAGVDLDVTGGCRDRIPDWIACGPHYCAVNTSYCEIVLSDVFELPSDYTCKPLPAACAAAGEKATCDCFPRGTKCVSFCGPIVSATRSGFHLTCRL